MTPTMSNTRVAIIIFIISEIPAAIYGGVGAWRSRSKLTDKRTIVGMETGIALWIYAVARLMSLTTAMQYGALITTCLRDIETRGLVQAIIQATAIWIMAFAFTGDDRPGWFRAHVRSFFSRWQ